ncbi:hypothetical protein [Mangrovibrevibacter kandeliae]|uniref:hypothetical protein n=1 Tax=Mangrovibrevibacter kandeliae TaxID=2968473 RepID=UPI002117FA8B|nr:hypothetical protein [Aurantimonas sp. CSK15Z-1]MCQ8783339.1 hypothetical protein [Aurantimonas sp. CSK15Z-1]
MIGITSTDDPRAPQGDLRLKIEFDPASGSPARIFEIASDLIRSFEEIDRALLESVTSRIDTTFVLEDVQRSSLLVVLRNILKQVDDDALKDLDWKKQVGKYLVEGKYLAIRWLDRRIDDGQNAGLPDLTDELRQLAVKTDVLHFPDYPLVKASRLAQALDEVQRAKAKLGFGEGLVIDLGKGEYRVNVRETWLPSDHMPPEAQQDLANELDVVYIVRRPDFLGNAQWAFKHGRQSISAPIHDEEWLERFRTHEETIRPGDALRVRARYETTYDEIGAMVDQKVEIVKVYGVIRSPTPSARGLFDDED